MVAIYIFMMIFDKHFFIYLLTIYTYIYTIFSYTCWYFYIFFLNIYSDFFPHFSISLFRIWVLFCPVGFCLFAVFYWVLWVPCILWILTSLQIHGLQFSFSIPYVVFSFSCLLIVPFAAQKLVSLTQSYWFTFAFATQTNSKMLILKKQKQKNKKKNTA